MIAPVHAPRVATRISVPKQEGDNAPIQVRRLNRDSIHRCRQNDSVTGLYIGQAVTLEIAGEWYTFSSGNLLILPQNTTVKARQVIDVWVLEFLWEALTPFSSGVGSTFPAWRHFAATLNTATEHPKRYVVPNEERTTWQRCLQTLDQELRGAATRLLRVR